MPLRDLVPELHLIILGFLDLPSLIALRQTGMYWNRLVDHEAERERVILPTRTKLLKLYLSLYKSEAFLESRRHILSHLKPWSRTEYVGELRAKLAAYKDGCRLPADFETWLLEWPEWAVIGWAWPGLDDRFDTHVGPRDVDVDPHHVVQEHWWRTYGSNLLWRSYGPNKSPEPESSEFEGAQLRVLRVQDHGCGITTAIFLSADSELHGCVWRQEDLEPEDMEKPEVRERLVVRDWVAWLRRELVEIEQQYAGVQME